jgi:glycosyltransferase involved in cell wall biosynthesis
LDAAKDLWRVARVLGLTASFDTLILFGSQRFVTVTGSALVAVYKPLRRKVYIRYNGGACDLFYEQSNFVYRWLMRRVLSRADAIVVETDMLKTNMTAVWGDRVFTVPNYRQIEDAPVGQRLFRGNSVSFIYVGMVRKLKGLDDLLAAFERLRFRLSEEKQGISVALDIYGPVTNTKLEPLETSCHTEETGVRFHGQVGNHELIDKYHRSDVFVFPTYWPTEGHPGAVIEAFQYGLPVISSSWRAIPEVVVHEHNGLLCEPRQVDDLADAMYRLCVDLPLRKRLSANAEKSAKYYVPEKHCAKLASIFGLCPDQHELPSAQPKAVTSS